MLRMSRIRKSFGAVEVLHGVDFDVQAGEVHVLAGENGAGKSTLIKILSGVYPAYGGQLELDGRARRFATPQEAAAAGVATIHQELSLVASMSVADNLFLGRERTRRFGWLDRARQAREAQTILDDAGIAVSPRATVANLPVSVRQQLEIGRALARDARLLVFDEPTSALNEPEAAALFARITELRRRGRGIIYITHRLDEIYRLADRITVLRDGTRVGTATPDGLPRRQLVHWMVGREVESALRPAESDVGGPLLEVDDLSVEQGGRVVVDGVSLTLRKGEICGLAGLQGAGVSHVLHALFGAYGRAATARIRLDGEPVRLTHPRRALAAGVMLLTNDRKTSGLAFDLSVLHNASLASLDRFVRFGFVRRAAERAAVAGLSETLRLQASSLDAPVRTLSGGNQQKVCLARCVLPRPRILLLDEPTRGVDVGAKADIYALLREWAAAGISILLVTSEMDELLALADRVLVFCRGRVAAELDRDAATSRAVLRAAMGEEE